MLESALGVRLLLRSQYGVQLTNAGKVFLEEALGTLMQSEHAMNRARRAGRGEVRRLSIGIAPTSETGIIPRIVSKLVSRQPEIQLELHSVPGPDQVAALHAGRIDVGFLLVPPGRNGQVVVGLEEWRRSGATLGATGASRRVKDETRCRFSGSMQLPPPHLFKPAIFQNRHLPTGNARSREPGRPSPPADVGDPTTDPFVFFLYGDNTSQVMQVVTLTGTGCKGRSRDGASPRAVHSMATQHSPDGTKKLPFKTVDGFGDIKLDGLGETLGVPDILCSGRCPAVRGHARIPPARAAS